MRRMLRGEVSKHLLLRGNLQGDACEGQEKEGDDMNINRVWQMPNSDTFQVKPIGDFVRKYLADSHYSVDPFARNCDWADKTNDLNPDTSAEFHMEAAKFLEGVAGNPDLVILDPPYSLRQAKEYYNGIGINFTQRDGQIVGRWKEVKDEIGAKLAPGGIVLSFGWNSVGMGIERGFEIMEILLVCHGGGHNDTICMAEKLTEGRLFT